MPTTRSTTDRRKKAPTKRIVAQWFQQWLTVKDEASVLAERQTIQRDRILDAIIESGEEDEKGHVYIDLDEPLTFTDHNGKVFQYSTLKRERHLTPSQPGPSADKAEDYLRAKGLWLTEQQEAALSKLRLRNRYVDIEVTVNTEAVTEAFFRGEITPAEYDALLTPQKETFQFRPSES